MGALRTWLAVAVLVGAGAGVAPAGPVLTLLSPDGTDLSTLQVGDTVTLQVTLSGLQPGDTMQTLSAVVQYPAGVFQQTGAVSFGGAVPDATRFTGTQSPGTVGGSYSALVPAGGLPITDEGVFFAFDLTVTGSGDRSITFQSVGGTGTDANGQPLPAVEGQVRLDVVRPQQPELPEPGTMVLMLLGVAGGLGWRRWSGRAGQ